MAKRCEIVGRVVGKTLRAPKIRIQLSSMDVPIIENMQFLIINNRIFVLPTFCQYQLQKVMIGHSEKMGGQVLFRNIVYVKYIENFGSLHIILFIPCHKKRRVKDSNIILTEFCKV